MNYGSQGIKQKKKLLNSAATKFRTKLGVFAIKFILILAIAVVVSGSCLLLGSVQGIIASAPDISTIDVSPDGFATKIYNSDGEEIQTLSTSGSNRISVDIEQVPKELQHAFVAIEDERFYEHNGIDIKGIVRAAYNTVSGGGLSQGASTLTQQLIKNNVFNVYNETDLEKIKRKVQEQYLAVKLETYMSKEDILENYLNTINLGNGYYGVQAAANGYFGKDVSELTLSECAVIASITQNPTKLNPLRYPDDNKERQQKVLKNMLEQGYISQAEYIEAASDDVYARIEGLDINTGSTTYSYFVDTLIEELIDDLMTQKGYTETQATNLIYKGGLQVYSTQDTSMQEIADSVINDPSYYPSSTEFSISYALSVKTAEGKIINYSHSSMQTWYENVMEDSKFSLIQTNEDTATEYVERYKEAMTADGSTVIAESLSFVVQPQISFSLMDQHTGYVKVLVGGRGDKYGNRTLNRATNSPRQPGSCIKPLVAYGPALDTNAITLATAIDDAPYYYSSGQLVKNYTTGDYRGLMTTREAIYRSENVPAVKVLTLITPQVGFNYLEKFGLSSLVSPSNAINGNHDIVQPLALGGMTLGVYNIDMTAAYAAIANNGTYIAPIYYTEVYDYKGNLILDNTVNETHSVLKETTAWLLTSALQSVVTQGTGGSAAISNQPVAGKTGTTQYDSDKWFCGFTPYYTASIWLGYDDDNSKILPSSINHSKIWSAIMSQIHADLPTGSFEQPEGIVEVAVCSQSGKLPVEGVCDSDPRGSQIITEFFSVDNQPTETCDTHVKVTVCNDSGSIASVGCTNTSTRVYIKKSSTNLASSASSESEDNSYSAADSSYAITDEMLTKLCALHSNTRPTAGATTNASSSTTQTTGAASSTAGCSTAASQQQSATQNTENSSVHVNSNNTSDTAQ
jgi:penicillin-binding protein 1A